MVENDVNIDVTSSKGRPDVMHEKTTFPCTGQSTRKFLSGMQESRNRLADSQVFSVVIYRFRPTSLIGLAQNEWNYLYGL